MSDQGIMDQNENTSNSKAEAKVDESHQAQPLIHLPKTSDADVDMKDEKDQESENDSIVTDAREEELEEELEAEEEVKIVGEVSSGEPVEQKSVRGNFMPGVDKRVTEVKTEIPLSEIPICC